MVEEPTSIDTDMAVMRNNLSPTYRLPAEILSLIFRYHGGIRFLDVGFSHVCSYWRAVALDSPLLWNELPLRNPRWLQEMLTRSKTAGLTIMANLSTLQMEHTQRTILTGLREILQSHSSRIQHLGIGSIPHTLQSIFDELPVTAPMLETIQFSALDRREPSYLPVGVLANTERLRSVHLDGINAQWNKLDLRNVTNLSLVCLRDKVPFADAIDAFRNMPKLMSLNIEGALLPHGSTVQDGLPHIAGTVHLRHLRRLSMYLGTDEFKAFFLCVTFPYAAAKVQVHVVNPHKSTECRDGLSFLAQFYSDVPLGQEFHSVVMTEHYLFHLNCIELLGNKGAETPSLQFLTEKYFPERFISDILSTFRLEKVAHIDSDKVIDQGMTFSFKNYSSIYTALSSLQTVSSISIFEYEHPTKLDKLLLPFSDSEAAGEDGKKMTVFFPRLKSLSFHRLEINTDPDNITIDQLEHALVKRRDCGSGIESLVFAECQGLCAEDIARLKEIIDDVQWDGKYSTDVDKETL